MGRPKRQWPFPLEKIHARYMNGESLTNIVESEGCPREWRNALQNRLRRDGFPAPGHRLHSEKTKRRVGLVKRKHHLPLAEISQRYLNGEELHEILESYPPLDSSDPVEAIRRQLLREGYPAKTRQGINPGSKNFQWKGGRTSTVHYYRRQSYEIAAICEGKPLEMGEIIHHDDEVPQNNAPENLLIFRSASAHLRFHQRLLKFQRAGIEVDSIQLAIENGARRLQRPACLNGWKPDTTLQPLLEKMDRRTVGQRNLPSSSQ